MLINTDQDRLNKNVIKAIYNSKNSNHKKLKAFQNPPHTVY